MKRGTMLEWVMWLDEMERLVELATGTELIILYTWSVGAAYTMGRVLQLYIDEKGRFWPPRVASLTMAAAGCLLAWPVMLGFLWWPKFRGGS